MSETGRIRIGNQTAFSALTPTQPFEYAVENGFDAFEWFPDKKESGAGWQEDDLDVETRRQVKNTAFVHDMRLSVHVPWQLSPVQPKACERLFEDLEFAKDIGASLLNIHLDTDEGIGAYVDAIVPCITRLAQVGVKLSIENTPLTAPEDFNELFRRLHNLGFTDAAQVGMCLDIGHANLCSATCNDYLKFIDLLDPRVPIIHIHMHENYGDYDSHLPLFSGPADEDASGIQGFIGRLKKRNFSGCIILEQWPQPPTLLNEARNRLREMIGKVKPGVVPYVVHTDDFANTIAKADQRHQSWREKLGWIHDLLTDDTFHLNTEPLVYLAIYLRFIGTGEVYCTEDGRHYRPSHHAKIARRIHDRLSKITTSDNVFIIRKIYPWLPSYNSAFTRAEPLTRIRAIAHRNDIPKELKHEIKRTLQNKLHRCAGPEDLATSAAMLERITAPDADYSPAFVEEFKKFHEQLKEFFNAHSLEEQLEGITKKANAQEVEVIQAFLEAKEVADTAEEQLTTFELLTTLRGRFHKRLKGKSSPDAQELLIADIRLEDFSFVLSSQLINHFEASEDEMPWSPALYAMALTVENLRLSGFDVEECQAVESELNFWRQGFEPRDIQQLIRLKATLDRCLRLAEVYCDKILALFPEKVEKLGRALGVAEHAIKGFSEADIRSHLVFQLSKLVALFLKRIRTHAALSRPVSPRLPLMALFDKRIEGDDALLHLANLRFKEGGLGTELYADTPVELEWLLRFRPTPEAPAVVHLSRGINLFEEESHILITDFAEGFKDQVFGLVIHDQVETATRFDDYLAALRKMESRIKEVEGGPYLFIEYAVGLEPELFIELFKAILDLKRVSACVDIGHIGLWQARSVYSRKHPEEDVCAITPHNPELPELIEDVQGAVRSALDTVLHVIRALGHLGKPLHFHLHDAHPLSTFSPFGISDHLSFMDEIPIPFEYKGKKSLHPMFGPSGLLRIITESLQLVGPDRVSFSLEIHPIEGRLPLGDASYLFNHWEDKGNAERMNYWLSVLFRNHQLVSEACEKSLLN